MQTLIVEPMDQVAAKVVSGWQYEPPFSVYSFTQSEETMDELLDGSYYSVSVEDEVIGFYCFGSAAQVAGAHQQNLYQGENVIDFGLGMRPDLTGQGLGERFVKRGVDVAIKYFRPAKIRLCVITFNNRAIKVYEKVGFRPVTTFMSKTPTGEQEFLMMEIQKKENSEQSRIV